MKNEHVRTALLSRLIAICIIFPALFIGLGISRCSSNAKEEVEFSLEVKNYNPAYIYVESMEPEFGVSPNYGVYIQDLVCRCITASDETVWLYISVLDYNEYFDPDASFGSDLYGSSYTALEFSEGTIIHGVVRDANDLCSGLERQTAETVLRFQSLENK